MGEQDPELLVIGHISGVYGVKGWVKIHSYTEPVENLLGYRGWMVQRRGKWESLAIDAGKRHGKGLIAHIKCVDDRDAAAALSGGEIAVLREQLPELEADQYYWYQLEGLAVVANGELLGQVDHMLETGANDVMVVKPVTGSRDKRERLIPWLRDSVVKSIDLQERVIEVDWDPEF